MRLQSIHSFPPENQVCFSYGPSTSIGPCVKQVSSRLQCLEHICANVVIIEWGSGYRQQHQDLIEPNMTCAPHAIITFSTCPDNLLYPGDHQVMNTPSYRHSHINNFRTMVILIGARKILSVAFPSQASSCGGIPTMVAGYTGFFLWYAVI